MDMRCTTQDVEQPAAMAPGGAKAGMADLLRQLLGCQDDAPSLLERRFPHIIRRIEELWGRDEIHPFLDALTPPEGSPCKGFPTAVEAEIRHFRGAYRKLHPVPAAPEPAPADTAPEVSEAPAAAQISLADDYDIWKNERRLRGWEERSIF